MKKFELQRGQIWKLGENYLVYGDSIDESLVQKVLRGKQVNTILTDPPYGVSYTESKKDFADLSNKKDIANDNITNERDYADFVQKFLAPVIPFLAQKNNIYIFNCDKMLFAVKAALDALGMHFSQLLVWVKSKAVIGRKDYLPQHELIISGWYKTHKWRGCKDKSVFFYPKPNKSTMHPTVKPLQLVANLILNTTDLHDVVYDPFLGSGTTLIACEQTKRACIGFEIEEEYVNLILNRWAKITGKEPELLTTDERSAD